MIQKVTSKVTKDGAVMLVKENGKEYFYSRDELTHQIAFSEQELMLKDRDHYRYDIADRIKPRLRRCSKFAVACSKYYL